MHPGVVLTELCKNFFKEAGTNGINTLPGRNSATSGAGNTPQAPAQTQSVTPASIVTGLQDAMSSVVDAMRPVIMKTPLRAARDTIMWAVTAPSVEVGGRYVADGGVAGGLKVRWENSAGCAECNGIG